MKSVKSSLKSAALPTFQRNLKQLAACFGSKESTVLRSLARHIDKLPDDVRREVLETVRRTLQIIPPLVQAIEAFPVHHNYTHLNRPERNAESLIEKLCNCHPGPVELSVPTGVVLGKALVVARINFLKALNYSLDSATGIRWAQRTTSAFQELVDEAIFSMLADDLLTGAASNPMNAYDTRRAAARHLVSVWNDRVRYPVADFPTILLSAWRARRRVRATYGTLFGFDELSSLVREECEPAFVSFFTRDQASADETEAFREFLFGLPYEELQQLQHHMKETGIPVLSREQVYRIVNKTLPERELGDPSAEEVYGSYRRRSIRAEYRSLSSSPGPHKTAEGYLMEYLLKEEAARENGER